MYGRPKCHTKYNIYLDRLKMFNEIIELKYVQSESKNCAHV